MLHQRLGYRFGEHAPSPCVLTSLQIPIRAVALAHAVREKLRPFWHVGAMIAAFALAEIVRTP